MFRIGSHSKKYRVHGFPGLKAQSRERKNYQNPGISRDPGIPGLNISTFSGPSGPKIGAEGAVLENFGKFSKKVA